MRKLKGGKAARICNITEEMLKTRGKAMIQGFYAVLCGSSVPFLLSGKGKWANRMAAITIHGARKKAHSSAADGNLISSAGFRDLSNLGSCLASQQFTRSYQFATLWNTDLNFDRDYL